MKKMLDFLIVNRLINFEFYKGYLNSPFQSSGTVFLKQLNSLLVSPRILFNILKSILYEILQIPYLQLLQRVRRVNFFSMYIQDYSKF